MSVSAYASDGVRRCGGPYHAVGSASPWRCCRNGMPRLTGHACSDEHAGPRHACRRRMRTAGRQTGELDKPHLSEDSRGCVANLVVEKVDLAQGIAGSSADASRLLSRGGRVLHRKEEPMTLSCAITKASTLSHIAVDGSSVLLKFLCIGRKSNEKAKLKSCRGPTAVHGQWTVGGLAATGRSSLSASVWCLMSFAMRRRCPLR